MFIIRYRRLFGDEREEVLYIQMDCSKFELEAGLRDYLDKERSVITFFCVHAISIVKIKWP